jgi:hypothetical protein
MTPRRLPLRPDTLAARSLAPAPAPARAASAASAGWARKAFAITVHMACLGLFWLVVVVPVASPIASGELAREFKPVLRALEDWSR